MAGNFKEQHGQIYNPEEGKKNEMQVPKNLFFVYQGNKFISSYDDPGKATQRAKKLVKDSPIGQDAIVSEMKYVGTYDSLGQPEIADRKNWEAISNIVFKDATQKRQEGRRNPIMAGTSMAKFTDNAGRITEAFILEGETIDGLSKQDLYKVFVMNSEPVTREEARLLASGEKGYSDGYIFVTPKALSRMEENIGESLAAEAPIDRSHESQSQKQW